MVTEVSKLEDNAAYIRLYRTRSPDYVARQRILSRTRNAGLCELARRHRKEFETIVEDLRAKEAFLR